MKNQVGVWIDHRKAVIVTVTDQGEETRLIESDMEKHVRFARRDTHGGAAENMHDRQFANRLDAYYDKVIASIRDAESILIFGPGEAKGEIKKRLENGELEGRIVGIETVDKMTDRQIAARVREYFPA